MARQRRLFGANAASEIPSNMVFVDTEAKQIKHNATTIALVMRMWCSEWIRLENGRVRSHHYFNGPDAATFWESIDNAIVKKKSLFIYAHNLAYDAKQLKLWEQFDNGRLIYQPKGSKKKDGSASANSILAIEGRPWFIKCKHSSGNTVWLVDTMNYFSCSLAELGDMVCLPKLEIDVNTDDDMVLYEYCRRDVAIIAKAMTELIINWQDEGLGNFRSTAAGLSLQNYKHWHCDSRVKQIDGKQRWDIVADPDSPCDNLEREAYMGGRIEAFRMGTYQGKFYHLDVRSMYPSVMASEYYPIDRIKSHLSIKVEDLAKLLPAHEAVAEVLIMSWNNTYPLRYKGRQVHASGQFWTVLCGRELQRAIDSGNVQAVGNCIIYRTAPIFAEWVTYWWNKREHADRVNDRARSCMAKLIMNSLHGKFAQKGVKWVDSPICPPILRGGEIMRWGSWYEMDPDGEGHCNARVFAGNVQLQTEGEPPSHSFPAISAIISANARERLRDLIEICPVRSVYYVSTDSLICDESAFNALLKAGEIDGRKLGKLQVKGTAAECEIISQGCYRLDDEWTSCGLWAKAELDGKGIYKSQMWRRDKPIEYGMNEVAYIDIIQIEKTIPRPKGRVRGDGWIEPIEIVRTPECLQLTPEEERKLLNTEDDLDAIDVVT